MTYKYFSLLIAGIAALAITGCGPAGPERLKVHPVEGQVQLDGQPLAGAFVVLHPKLTDPKYVRAHAQTDAAGKFKATTYDANDGAIAGDYAITIEYQPIVKTDDGYSPAPNQLPPKYASPATTDVVVRIAEGENKLPVINLKR